MPIAERTDPYLNFQFQLEIEGLIIGGFTQANGLQSEIETEAYREGGVNEYAHHLPTGAQHTNLTLKKGMVDHTLLDWHLQAVNGRIQRKTVRVAILNMQGIDGPAWVVKAAFPVRWQGPELQADQNGVAVESIELAHQGIEKV